VWRLPATLLTLLVATLATLINPSKSPAWNSRKYQAIEAWDVNPDLWERWAAIYNHQEDCQGASGPLAARRFFELNREAMLEGSRVLWPQREDYYALRELRLTSGQASFDSEKQNEPIDMATCLFREEDMRYWDDQFKTEEELLAYLHGHVSFFGACDPSLGKLGKHRDDSAIVTLACDHRTGLMYVLDADIARREPSKIIEAVIEHHSRRGYAELAMESTQFQEFLAEELIKRSCILRCHCLCIAVRSEVNRTARKILYLMPLAGKVR
jgi:hypothetical protein